MNSINKLSATDGFTLIETMLAMAIFAIGILGLFGMQHAAIKLNVAGNRITTSTTFAVDRVEAILALHYIDPALADTNYDNDNGINSCSQLSNWPNSMHQDPAPQDSLFNIYWNVALDCSLTDVPFFPTQAQDQRPKHIRIIVTKEVVGGKETEFAVLDYIKQNVK